MCNQTEILFLFLNQRNWFRIRIVRLNEFVDGSSVRIAVQRSDAMAQIAVNTINMHDIDSKSAAVAGSTKLGHRHCNWHTF